MTRSFRGVRLVRFGDFELDVRAAELRKHGIRIRLQEQPYRILTMLLDRPGEVVLREEIRRRLWPNDTVVEVSHGINAAVLRLRDALGESAENPRYVETLARRGYRFTGQVEVIVKERAESPGPIRTASPHAAPPTLDTADLTGQTVSHYRVLDRIGGGGMGVVYRAEDLKLGRHVALKFLPRELVRDPVALGRFEREARTASALNHPNICTIYGVEDCSGQPVIAMELIEGESLEAMLAKGRLTLEKALPLAIQIAGALDAAHRKGIVHRDLKPANVLVTRSGAKVLDFGLAKIQRALAAGVSSHVTQEGVILGTLHYMSPEQVQGKEADARSDIFAFGLVLYEMLAGRRAFAGVNTATVMAAILTAEPPEIGEPAVIAPALRRCLAKDPEDRWQSAGDLQAALEWVVTGWRPAAPPAEVAPMQLPTPGAPPMSPARAWSVAAAVVLVLIAALLVPRLRDSWSTPIVLPPALENGATVLKKPITATPAQPARFNVVAPDGAIMKLRLSPDGRNLVFLAGGRLYLRSLDSQESRVLPGDRRGNGTPFWSPDSRFIAFPSAGKLNIVDLNDGKTTPVWDVNTTLAGSWSRDGTILIGLIGDGIYRVQSATGLASRVTTVDSSRAESRHLTPQFLPDGRHFLFTAGSATGASALYAAALDSTDRARIMTVSSNVVFTQPRRNEPSGYLIFLQDRILMAQPFDPVKLRTTGDQFPVAGPVVATTAMGAAVSIGDFSAAESTLAFRSVDSSGTVTVTRNWLGALKQ